MLLTVDAGNSNIVAGIFEDTDIITNFRIKTDHYKSFDEYAVIFTQLIERNKIGITDLDGCIIASVAPGLLDILTQTVSVYLDIEPVIVNSNIQTGIEIICGSPNEIGVDRIANGVGAFEKYNSASIVVDFGTATTFDCISSDAEFLGGIIAPGFLTSADALFQKAPRLPRVEFIKPQNAIGKNTTESLQSGLIFGYACMVDGMIERIMYEMNTETSVIATGGLSHTVSRVSRYIEDVDEYLTLRGLRKIYELNV